MGRCQWRQNDQGAGEDATLDLFRILEGIPNFSLLMIDEVEASLHPLSSTTAHTFFIKPLPSEKVTSNSFNAFTLCLRGIAP